MSTEKAGFKSDADIRSFFKDIKNQQQWQKVPDPKLYDFTDEWFKWYHTRANGQDNVFLSRITKPPIYFVQVPPFESPHFKRVTIKKKASLLVPLYCFSASEEEYPSLKEESKLLELIEKDLSGIDWTSVKATLDGKSLSCYCVIRDKPLSIKDIPPNNPIKVVDETLDVYHGGFWLLIEQPDLPPGDHVLHLKANSKTYEMEAKILINATY
jgi:hypothetical protein